MKIKYTKKKISCNCQWQRFYLLRYQVHYYRLLSTMNSSGYISILLLEPKIMRNYLTHFSFPYRKDNFTNRSNISSYNRLLLSHVVIVFGVDQQSPIIVLEPKPVCVVYWHSIFSNERQSMSKVAPNNNELV